MKLLKIPIVLTVSEEGLESLQEWVKQDGFKSLDEMISYLTMDSLIQDFEDKIRACNSEEADRFRAQIEATMNKARH
jgi:hypothetical protein